MHLSSRSVQSVVRDTKFARDCMIEREGLPQEGHARATEIQPSAVGPLPRLQKRDALWLKFIHSLEMLVLQQFVKGCSNILQANGLQSIRDCVVLSCYWF